MGASFLSFHYLIRKIFRYLFSFVIILLVVFLLPRMMPGDPIANLVGEDVYLSPQKILELRSAFGLDSPLHEQFFVYCMKLYQLDLGYSFHMHAPVSSLLIDRAAWTLLYIGIAIVCGIIIGVGPGEKAGWESEKWWAHFLSAGAVLISSTPPYLLSLIVLVIFVYHFGWFPLKGFYDTFDITSIIHHLVLPISVLTVFYASRNFLIMRGAVLSEKCQLYPQFVRSLGIPEKDILSGHIRKNAIIPLITLIALDFGFLFSGALFIEIVFSLNGMGSLIYDAILSRDYPVLTGSFLVISVF
ncbi:MAG TPA: ABC transporter permease, partial [Methanospirillum sp.]|nr:ABC transporter permease [Methanospirillum sp.]